MKLLAVIVWSYIPLHSLASCLAIDPRSAPVQSKNSTAPGSFERNSSIATSPRGDYLYEYVRTGLNIGTTANPSARPICINVDNVQLRESLAVDIVFSAFPQFLLMRMMVAQGGITWTGPKDLPPEYPVIKSLPYFFWSDVKIGITQAQAIILRRGIRVPYNAVFILEESWPTKEIYYHFYHPNAGDYSAVRVGAESGRLVVDDPRVTPAEPWSPRPGIGSGAAVTDSVQVT